MGVDTSGGNLSSKDDTGITSLSNKKEMDVETSCNNLSSKDDTAITPLLTTKEMDEDTSDRNLSSKEDTKITPLSTKEPIENTYIADDMDITFNSLEHIDEHARKVPEYAEESIQTLADYLILPAKTELEMVRAFYVWITDNISYDFDAYLSDDKSKPNDENILKSKTSLCGGYASLFLQLCRYKNIQCEKISGYSKGYGHTLGGTMSYEKKTDHAWNVVFIEGKWRFIETTWGAGYIGNEKFVKRFLNFYFLTSPKDFIADHFPYIDANIEGSQQWQLLEKPISLDEFSSAFKPSSYARHWGIEFPSSKNENITLNKSYTIIIEAKKNPLKNISFDLWNGNGSPCQQYAVIVKENITIYSITIKPKETGQYILQIYGTVEDPTTIMPELAKYKIDCTATEALPDPYPEIDKYYGPRPDYAERGFDLSSPPASFQTCENGNLSVVINTKKNVNASASLYGDDGNEMPGFVLLEPTDKGLSVRARLTKTGYYRLIIFSEYEIEDKLSEAFNILIFNIEPSKIQLPFPKYDPSIEQYRCYLIEPLVNEVLANSSFVFKMSSPILDSLDINGEKFKRSNDSWSIEFKTGDSGAVQVLGKTNDQTSYSVLYEYEVKK